MRLSETVMKQYKAKPNKYHILLDMRVILIEYTEVRNFAQGKEE